MRNRVAGLAGVALLCLTLSAQAGPYIGDYNVGDTVCAHFNTYQPSTGASFTLASGAIRAYNVTSTTEEADDDGLTLDNDFDAVTGYHQACVDTSADGTFYAAGNRFSIILDAGTVDSVSVVGTEIFSFSLLDGTLATIEAQTDDIGTAGAGLTGLGGFANGAIAAADFAAGAIDASAIAADAIGASEIASAAIAADEIAADAIGASELATDAIGAAEIAANAVAAAEVADGAIDEATFATTAGSFKPLGILDQGTAQAYTAATPSLTLRAAAAFGDDALSGAVVMICGSTQGYCQSTTISTNTNADDVATLAAALEIEATGTITYYVFGTPQAGASLGEVTLADGGITSAKFASGAITATVIAADAIGASELAADAIGSSEIASAAIAADEIAADAIGASEIAADAIGSSELATGAIAAAEIAADAITSSEIADNAIDAGAIADNAIDAASTAADFSTEDQDANIKALDGTAITCTSGASCGP